MRKDGAKAMSEMLKTNTTLTALNLGREEEGRYKREKDELRLNERQRDWS